MMVKLSINVTTQLYFIYLFTIFVFLFCKQSYQVLVKNYTSQIFVTNWNKMDASSVNIIV